MRMGRDKVVNVDMVVKFRNVPDLPCPKCGCAAVQLHYMPAWPKGYDVIGCPMRLLVVCERCGKGEHVAWADIAAWTLAHPSKCSAKKKHVNRNVD